MADGLRTSPQDSLSAACKAQPLIALWRYGMAETCRCPRCGEGTHPEYLRSLDGWVLGCANCVSRDGTIL